MTLRLPAAEAEKIRRHAREAYPEECCGFLLGREGSPRVVEEARPAQNVHPEMRNVRYTIDPHAILAADRETRASGRALLGFYHSHPDHPPRPSAYDEAHAWPWYAYVILEVRGGEPKGMTAWQLDEEQRVFKRLPLMQV